MKRINRLLIVVLILISVSYLTPTAQASNNVSLSDTKKSVVAISSDNNSVIALVPASSPASVDLGFSTDQLDISGCALIKETSISNTSNIPGDVYLKIYSGISNSSDYPRIFIQADLGDPSLPLIDWKSLNSISGKTLVGDYHSLSLKPGDVVRISVFVYWPQDSSNASFANNSQNQNISMEIGLAPSK